MIEEFRKLHVQRLRDREAQLDAEEAEKAHKRADAEEARRKQQQAAQDARQTLQGLERFGFRSVWASWIGFYRRWFSCRWNRIPILRGRCIVPLTDC